MTILSAPAWQEAGLVASNAIRFESTVFVDLSGGEERYWLVQPDRAAATCAPGEGRVV